MASVVVPCITVENAEQFKQSVERMQGFASRVHIDISDGQFAPILLLDPAQIWWPQGWQVDIHAMVKHPSTILPQLIKLKPNLIIIHAEIDENPLEIIQQIKQAGIKAGIALLKTTVPAQVSAVIKEADHVMIFSGDLGKYGGTASLMQLEKARLIRKIKPEVEIGWDGGVSVENAFTLTQGGINVLNSGGAIASAPDPASAYQALVQETNKHGVI